MKYHTKEIHYTWSYIFLLKMFFIFPGHCSEGKKDYFIHFLQQMLFCIYLQNINILTIMKIIV